jgi:hypothetical protein
VPTGARVLRLAFAELFKLKLELQVEQLEFTVVLHSERDTERCMRLCLLNNASNPALLDILLDAPLEDGSNLDVGNGETLSIARSPAV